MEYYNYVSEIGGESFEFELGEVSFEMLNLSGLGEVSFGNFTLGETNFRMLKLGETSFGMLGIG